MTEGRREESHGWRAHHGCGRTAATIPRAQASIVGQSRKSPGCRMFFDRRHDPDEPFGDVLGGSVGSYAPSNSRRSRRVHRAASDVDLLPAAAPRPIFGPKGVSSIGSPRRVVASCEPGRGPLLNSQTGASRQGSARTVRGSRSPLQPAAHVDAAPTYDTRRRSLVFSPVRALATTGARARPIAGPRRSAPRSRSRPRAGWRGRGSFMARSFRAAPANDHEENAASAGRPQCRDVMAGPVRLPASERESAPPMTQMPLTAFLQ